MQNLFTFSLKNYGGQMDHAKFILVSKFIFFKFHNFPLIEFL